MIRYLLALVLTFSMLQSTAQIGVGFSTQIMPSTISKISPEQLKILQSSKTVFICKDSDDIETLKTALKEVWTFSDLHIIPYSESQSYDFTGANRISITGLLTTVESTGGGGYETMHIYLSLWRPAKSKKGKDIEEYYSRLELQITYVDFKKTSDVLKFKSSSSYFYNEANFSNWNPGLLKVYFQCVNDYLVANTNRELFAQETGNSELTNLSTNTLLIPDYCLLEYNPKKGETSGKLDLKELMEDYPYKYESTSAENLGKLILESNKPIYYLIYTRSAASKFLTIFNSKTGQIVYSKYVAISYNLKSKDFEELAKSIKKINK